MDVFEKFKNWREGEGDDQDRHRHLVRWVIRYRLRDRDRAHKWLQGWNEKHPGSILERDVRIEWSLGNRGGPNEWTQTKTHKEELTEPGAGMDFSL